MPVALKPRFWKTASSASSADERLQRAAGERHDGDRRHLTARHPARRHDARHGVDQPEHQPREREGQERLREADEDPLDGQRRAAGRRYRSEDQQRAHRQPHGPDDQLGEDVVDGRPGTASDRADEPEHRRGQQPRERHGDEEQNGERDPLPELDVEEADVEERTRQVLGERTVAERVPECGDLLHGDPRDLPLPRAAGAGDALDQDLHSSRRWAA